MKRAPELQPLSRQHRELLILARSLRLAGEGGPPVAEIAAGYLLAWERLIEPHLRLEESVVLPSWKRVCPESSGLAARLRAEHAELRQLSAELAGAAPETARALAANLGTLLHDHVRFEERVFYPEIEHRLAGEPLAALGREILACMPPHRCHSPQE